MPGRLSLLWDRDDVQAVRGAHPDTALVALDADLHAHLLDRHIDHLTPWDFVKQDERPTLECLEAAAWSFWFDHARAVYRGIDALQMVRYRHMRWLTRLSWVAHVTRRAVERLQPEVIVTFDVPAGHVLDRPAGQHAMPLLHAVIRGVAEQADVPVQFVSLRALAARRAEVADAATPHTSLREGGAARAVVPVGAVLFVGNGGELLRQLPVIGALHKTGGQRSVQIYKMAEPATVARLADAEHDVWHESAMPCPEDDGGAEALSNWRRAARSVFEARCRAAPAAVRGLFDNPWLQPHYDFLFGDYLLSMARHIRRWTALFDHGRPSAVVANYANPALDVASHMGIPTVVLPHGLLVQGDTALYQGVPERTYIAALSQGHRTQLVAAGLATPRICVTGDPAADDLVRPLRTNIGSAPALCVSGAPGRRRILLLSGHSTAPVTLGRLPEVDWLDERRDFDALGQLAARRPEWAWTIKCHPRYDHGKLYYERINRGLPTAQAITRLDDITLSDALRDCDVVVVANAMTSAIMEASAAAVPVIILDGALVWCDRRRWGLDPWPAARSVEDLERYLVELFADRVAYDRCLERSQRAARQYLGMAQEGPSATARCATLIRRLAADVCPEQFSSGQ